MKLRFIFSLILLIGLANFAIGQVDPVTWEYNVTYSGPVTSVHLNAKMKGDWAIYSQFTEPGGPIPTSFEFEQSNEFSLRGEVEEKSNPIRNYSDLFEVNVLKFKDEAHFVQKISKLAEYTTVRGNITYMVCDATKCLPPKTIPFEVKI